MNILRSAIIIAILIILVGIFVALVVVPEEVVGKTLPELLGLDEPSEDEPSVDPVTGEPVPRPTGGAGSSSGGGGGSSSTSSPGGFVEPTCFLGDSSYSLSSRATQETCITEAGSICEQKEVACSIVITNLEEETTGEFLVEVVIYQTGAGPPPYDLANISSILNPDQEQTIGHTFTLTSTGATGSANQAYTCVFSALSVPEEEVCPEIV